MTIRLDPQNQFPQALRLQLDRHLRATLTMRFLDLLRKRIRPRGIGEPQLGIGFLQRSHRRLFHSTHSGPIGKNLLKPCCICARSFRSSSHFPRLGEG